MKRVFLLLISYSIGTAFALPPNCKGLNDYLWKSDTFGARFDNGYFQCTYRATAKFDYKDQDDQLTSTLVFKKEKGNELCDDELQLQLKGVCRKDGVNDPIYMYDENSNRLSGFWAQPERIAINGTVYVTNGKYPGYMNVFFIPR